jgi:hypothetical protein
LPLDWALLPVLRIVLELLPLMGLLLLKELLLLMELPLRILLALHLISLLLRVLAAPVRCNVFGYHAVGVEQAQHMPM